MIQLPYINTRLHLKLMMQRYSAYAAEYNAHINKLRADDPENKQKYQTLKTTHRELFEDLILETGKRMMQNINNYQRINTEQGNTGVFSLLNQNRNICGDGYYVCSTNRYQLGKHNEKELSTISRNLLRLRDAGIITGKVYHGHHMNFELQISAEFMLVSDKTNPAHNPLENWPKVPETKAFSFANKIAFCKEEEKEKEQLKNKLYSANADLNSTGSQTADLYTGTLKRTEGKTETGPKTPQGTENYTKAGGRAFAAIELEKRGQKVDNLNIITKKDLTKWHTFHRLAHSAYFVDYLIDRIYSRRGVEIYPAVRQRAIEYAEKFYFPAPNNPEHTIYKPCLTIDDYTTRLNGLKWCIDAANRYAARNNAYFVLIEKYIDIDNQNGLTGTLKWWKEAAANAKDKATGIRNKRDLSLLHAKIRELADGKTTLMEAENYIENHLQKYKYVFQHSIVTIINKMEASENQNTNN